MKRCILFAFAIMSCLAVRPALSAAAGGEDAPIRVGLEDYYPPFAFTDENGNHTGFDQDVAEALCEAMERRCEFIIRPLDDLFADIKEGRIDFLVAGLATTEERLQHMDFTNSYFRSRSIYIGRPGVAVIDRQGLTGKRIGTQVDTIQAKYLQDTWGDVSIVVIDSFEAVLDKLYRGELDVALVDGLSGYEFLKSDRGAGFEVLADPLPSELLMSDSHIAVRKGAGDLRRSLNEALAAIRLNGNFDRISRKYFPFSIY